MNKYKPGTIYKIEDDKEALEAVACPTYVLDGQAIGIVVSGFIEGTPPQIELEFPHLKETWFVPISLLTLIT